MKTYGSVTDDGGQTYKTVVIGTQTWMAENLNYNATGSKCYGNSNVNCSKYGRLYNWAMAMALPDSCNTNTCASQVDAKHQGICPIGWHIPSDAEWTTLTDFVGGSSTAGTKLKAISGWNSYSGVPLGSDTYGFSALPGSGGHSSGSFSLVGDFGGWWSTWGINFSAHGWYMNKLYESVSLTNYDKGDYFYSVRCVKD